MLPSGRLLIEQEEEEAQLSQQHAVETYRARTMAETSEAQATAEGRRELARINRDSSVRAEQIERDRDDPRTGIAVRSFGEGGAGTIPTSGSRQKRARRPSRKPLRRRASQRRPLLAKQWRPRAKRRWRSVARVLALIRAQEEAAVDDTRVESQAGTVRAMAAAEAEASEMRARAIRSELLAKAEGDAAIFAAQNAQSASIVRMKVDLAKIEAIPQIVREMVKPAEKIESIRINHVTGFGPAAGGGGTNGAGGPAVNQVVDGILSMALQLPAVQKLGEEIGINIGGGIARVTGGIFETRASDPPDTAPADSK